MKSHNSKFALSGNKLQIKQSPDFETQSSYSIRIRTTDKGGLTYEKQLIIGVNDLPETNSNTLVEGTSFNKRLTIPVTIPPTGGKLSFKLNPLQFDGTDLKGIKDALEVALVDAVGKSVVATFQTGRDAFFNWTEGETVVTGKGVSFNSTTGIVTLDLTGVKPGQTNLVFHLINNDKDTTTNVTITDVILSSLAPLPLTLAPLLSATATTPNPVSPSFFNSATDVSASIGAAYHRTSFNEGNKELDVNVALKNQGSYGLNGTLVAIVNHISDPSVQVKNADGFTPEGLAYYRFTTINGKLDPTQLTSERTLVFRNPNGVQFSYDLTVLSDINAAPVIKSQPELEVIGGKKYQYQVKAEDLNGDSLTYKLLSAPGGMAIDPSTGLVSWNTSIGQIGNYQLAVEVNDGRGGIAQQNYNLAVITPPPNRPPVFTSTPVVDAAIGSIYKYQALAKDLDGDSLTFSLTSAPIGMTVDANTGVLTWNPTGSQRGTFDVSLGVSDNRGGTAQQQFKIRTGAAVDNHAPLIISDAVVDLNKIGGRIIVANDEWPLSNRGFQLAADTTNFVSNIANWFTGGQTGKFYAYSQNFGLADPLLAQTMRANGNTWTVGTSLPNNLAGLLQYDGIFVGEFSFDNNLLTDYVKAGGNVYTLAGTGIGGPTGEAGRWNNFLGNFGLAYDSVWNTILRGDVPTTVDSNHPLFKNVNSVYYSYGNGVRDLNSNDSSKKIIFKERETGNGLFGVYANPGQYQYQVKAIDVDNDRLIYSLDKAPTGMTIDASTGLITWQNNDWDWTEKLDVTVKVRDELGGNDTQSFTLNTVKPRPEGKISGAVYLDDGQPSERLVYFNDFEGNAPNLSNWSNSKIDTTPIGNRHFLGQYGGIVETSANRQTSLSLNNLGTHDRVTVGFDLYLLNSWDGNIPAYYSPDRWKLQVRDGQTLLDTTFMNSYLSDRQALSQSYPDNYSATGTIQNKAFTGATEVETLGYNLYGAYRDSVYHLEYTFDHADPNLIIDFIGGTDEVIFNESWGIDNVKVSVGLPKQGVNGEIIYLDNNKNGRLDAGEASTSTDPNGKYNFTLTPGNYTVAQVLPAGLTTNKPAGGSYNVTVRNGQSIGGLDFANLIDPSIQQTPPQFLSTPLLTATLDRKYRYQAVAKDDNFDPLTYDLAVKPDGMIIDSKTGVVTWIPTATQLGKTDAVIRVSDGKGGVDLQTFSIDVTQPNLAPGFINEIPGFTSYTTAPSVVKVAAGDTYRFQFKGLDPDSDPINYRIKSFNSQAGNNINTLGVSIDASTGLLTWNTIGQALGFYSATVGVIDNKGAENIQTFTLELTNTIIPSVNLAPVIASTPRNQTSVGQTYVYQIAATDPNSEPLTYSLIAPPTGMSVNNQGILTWVPTSAQLGQSVVKIQVSDGRGGIVTQQFGLDVVSSGSIINNSPEITSTPTFTTNLGKTYSYQLTGTDSDNDTLVWSLDNAPTGMVIDSATGILKWNPTSLQIGNQTIAVRLSDAYGLYVGQEYTLKVNGVNTPPQIQSSPNTNAGVNSPYKYQIKAVDAEGDAIQYTLGRRPTGMVVNSDTGLITWTPNATQTGTQIIDILVTDAQGAVTTQTYNLVVGTTPINQAPSITSIPKFTADTNSQYKYQVVGTDPENSQITYALATAPTGMVIDANTGLVTWNNPTLGNTNIKITATDTSGAVAVQEYTLTGNQNHAPVINSTPITQVTIGNTYRYDVVATDSDNDVLTYTVDNASKLAGVSIDKFGRITWKPNTANLGIKPVTVTVTDTIGAVVTQTYNLEVLADNTAPVVNLVRGTNIADIGETISFQVQATDNVGIKSKQLVIGSQTITLDANGVGTYTVTTAGVITATAIVTDINGNTSTKNTTVNVIDPTDVDAPNISLNLSGITNGIITGRTDIIGTVTDTNLDYYTLEVARFGTDNFKEVFRGTNSITNGTLGKFDPSLLENDSYTVRLTAFDTSGRGSQVSDQIDVTGDLKLGNFRLSFTDLTIPVTGIPISLTRTYDSLTSGTRDDFGYGWRMEFRDTDLRTSLKKDEYYEQLDYRTVGFNFGTRVYITLPGGKREGFTFSPQQVQGDLGGITGGRLYYPSFVSDKGVTSTLTVPGAEVKGNTSIYSANAGTSSGNPNGVLLYKEGKLFNLAGRPYVPQDDGFGNRYILTTKDGTQYEINATTGDLETVTDTNGNTLTYSDTAIVSSTGVKVTFERDNQGRIISVTDPLGQKVVYGYDAKGDLVSVKDRNGNTTQFQYNSTRSHYLDKIVDPLGREAVKTEYDEAGRLNKVLDVNGQGTSLAYDPNNSTETILDSYGKPTTYVYDIRGNVVNEIAANGGIITRTYDEDTNQLSETDADGVTTNYTYDNKRNVTSIVDANGNITRMAYGSNNKITSVTSPTGLTTTATYDGRGNLISSTDTNGLTTTFAYDANGRPLSQTSADGQTMQWGYDSKGNPIKMVDSQGNTTNSVFDVNGQIQTANSQFTLNGQTYTLDTNFTYDKQGRILTNTNSKGNSSNNTFNSLGQLTSQTDNLGNITTFKYDTKGQLIEQVLPDNTPLDNTDNPVVKMEYDTGGRKISETSATGLITRYVYDNLGRLIDTIIPDSTPDDLTDNPHLKTEYTLAGRIKAKTDIYGNREEYTYNNLGQEIQMKDVLGNITKYTYDQGGKLATVIDIKNRLTSYRYDNKGRLVETTYFDNSKASLTYDELNRVKTTTNELGQTDTYEHDKFGRVTAVINALSEKTSFEYDQRGNLIKITDANQHSTRHEYDQYARKTATIYADNSRVTFTYDKFDRVTTATDENTHSTAYFYDNLNQLIKVKQANGAETKYTYDNLGRLISTIDPNQNLTTYTYDQFNRTTAVILPLGQRNKTVYDKYGQIASTTDYNGDKINYGYDRYGRISQKSFTNPNLSTFNYTYNAITSQLSTVIDGRGTTTYTYDNKDRLASMTNPDGKAVSYGYDLIGNVTSLQTAASTTKYTYDKLNRLDLVKEGTRTLADYDYDPVGNLSQTKMADGSTEVRNYDVRNRLTQITTKNSVGYTFSGFTYTLDAVGNRKQVVENNGRTVDYQYDILNRLTTEQITDSTNGNRGFNYTYDLAGNRLTKGDSLLGVTNYSYDANNRLTQTGLGTTITQFTYDNNGSMINRTDGTNTVTYNWANDGENRLLGLTATNPTSTTSSQYVYNAMGSRVASTTDGVRTNYLVAGNLPQVLLEYDANGVITADYTQGIGLIRKQSANREGFYHTDALGSTRLITDNVGLVLDRYNYDAFGANLNQTNTFANSFQFAGEQRDGTGLDYLRARYYDPSLGRFISKDPYAGSITDPYSQHSYQYAHANPVRYTDPTGYFTMGEALATIDLMARLAVAGSFSFGAGYLLGAAASGEDIFPLFGEFAGGFASGVSGGFLTDVYEAATGIKIQPKHAMLYQAGNVAGIGVSFITGLRAATWAKAVTGPQKWVAGTLVGLDVYGAGKATNNLYQSYQQNGAWEQEDAWNLLAYVPLLGAAGGIKKFFAANKAAQADDVVRAATSNTVTKAGTCFVAGTEILTSEGQKKIEEIQVGDWVVADDPNTVGEIEYKQVLDTFVRHTDKLVDLYIDGEVISTTGEHPFWTPDKGWVEAKDLVVGSLVQTEDGRIIDVDRVDKREGDFTVYNFKVEGFHTYFVSDLGILVHNAVCDPNKPSPFLVDDPFSPESVAKRQGEWQNYYGNVFDPQAVARELGYTTRIPAQKAPFNSHGQTVFSNGNNYISRDIDSHNVTNGWKMFNKKGDRIGTYSSDLTTRLKD